MVGPTLPEGMKRRLTPKVQHIMEATVHGAILILSFLCMISVSLTRGVSKAGCLSKQIITIPKFLIIFLAILLASVFVESFAMHVIHVISCQSKWMVVKLSVVFFLYNLCFLSFQSR